MWVLNVQVKKIGCIMELKLVDIQSKTGTEFAFFCGMKQKNHGYMIDLGPKT